MALFISAPNSATLQPISLVLARSFAPQCKDRNDAREEFFIALIFPPSPHISLDGYAPFRVTSVLCKLIFIESANKFANLPQQSCPLKYLKCLNSSRIVVEIHVRFLVVCETVFLCRHTAAVRVSKRTKKST